MAIIIKTENPKQLLHSLNTAIKNKEILTWMVDDDGDYTITRDQWQYHAWMKPYSCEIEGVLRFGIVQSRRFRMTKELYGIYHGRFVATLLSHFDTQMENIEITPLLIKGVDLVEVQSF